jgi:hypothetical protein
MTQEEIDEDEDMYYCWEEQVWLENRLFYEYDLEHLEELNKRERHPTKEKRR